MNIEDIPGNHEWKVYIEPSFVEYKCHECEIKISLAFRVYNINMVWESIFDKTNPIPSCSQEKMRKVLG